MTLLPDNLLPTRPEDLPPAQREALEAARQVDVPTTEPEDWRYSRIDDLELDDLRPAAVPGSPPEPGEPADRFVPALKDAAAELVLAAGQNLSWHSSTEAVTFDTVTAGPGEAGSSASQDDAAEGDAFTLLNRAMSPVTHQITVGAKAVVAEPVVVLDAAAREGELAAPRLRIAVGSQASVTIVHLVHSQPGHGVTVPVTEVDVADGAQVALITLHALAPGSWVIGRVLADIGRDARLRLHTFSTGGHFSRMSSDVTLAGAGSTLENRGIYLGTDDQMHDFRIRQRHVGEHTNSRFVLRGVVRDTSQGVFTGVVRMERGARGSDGSQDAKHLVLEDGAHVDSVPNLEIEENQVVCAHASSIGPVDADQVFYLESRGVPTERAVRLIARGFFKEGERGLGPPELAEAVSSLITDRLRPQLAAPILR